MKLLLVLVIATAVVSFPTDNDLQTQWNNFKLLHKKMYTKEEERKRFEIFKNNIMKIEEHNKLYDENKVLYHMSLNQFADLTSEEFLQFVKKPKISTTKKLATFEHSVLGDLPDAVDWREEGAVTPVKDQSICAANWPFGVTGTLEGQNFIKTGNLIPLSEQELADCTEGGCTGGSVDEGYEYVAEHGLAAAVDYPTDTNGTCSRGTIPSAVTEVGWVSIFGDEETLKAAVAVVGPISVEVDAEPWQLYASGVFYSDSCTNTPNHGVLLVGYGKDGDQDFWLIKNSWGVNWGEDGYIRLARNADKNCGITVHPTYPVLD